MTDLLLDVRLDGYDAPIGSLRRDDRGALHFAYTSDYVARADAVRLSLSLPIAEAPYGDAIARSFFDNLLQERDGALNQVMARETLSRDDIAGLLWHLGKDCAGALSVLPAGAPPVKVPGDLATDYEPLSDQQLTEIVSALRDRRRLPDGTSDPSPLAGVQSKIALTQLDNGSFAQPRSGSGAPTTHILKVPDRDHPRDARHEAAALDLSRACGMETAYARVLTVGDIDTLLVSRFDRARDERGRVIRLHQEDFAQALGLPAALKYQRKGTTTRRFDGGRIGAILSAISEPVVAREAFIRWVLFDLFTGNVDNHAKNFALLHLGQHIRLAPRYDLLPTRLDPDLTDELAFDIGRARRLDAITADDLQQFLATLGVATRGAQRRLLQQHAGAIATELAAAFDELARKGMKGFADLIARNMRHLLHVIGVAVPETAQSRDAFVTRGGGWLGS